MADERKMGDGGRREEKRNGAEVEDLKMKIRNTLDEKVPQVVDMAVTIVSRTRWKEPQ